MKNADGSEFGDWSGGGKEHLKRMDGLNHFALSHFVHVANGFCSLKVDHLAFMPQPTVKELKHWFAKASVVFS